MEGAKVAADNQWHQGSGSVSKPPPLLVWCEILPAETLPKGPRNILTFVIATFFYTFVLTKLSKGMELFCSFFKACYQLSCQSLVSALFTLSFPSSPNKTMFVNVMSMGHFSCAFKCCFSQSLNVFLFNYCPRGTAVLLQLNDSAGICFGIKVESWSLKNIFICFWKVRNLSFDQQSWDAICY